MKTLSDLRIACKKHGIKVKKETLSWGPHISFMIDGARFGDVVGTEFYLKNKNAYEVVPKIKQEFADLTIDGQKVYGLK
jgi:hypothetical protein